MGSMKITVDDYINNWKGDKQEHLLVDFRNWREVKEGGAIEKAMPASIDEVYESVDMIPTFIPCIGVCKSGEDSKALCEFLEEKGLTQIFYIEGGAEALLAS